jgi:simple sugar transport system substrate-binding protein
MQEYRAAGFGLSPETLQLIGDGRMHCTTDQQPHIQGIYPVVQLTHCLRYGIMPLDMAAGAAIVDGPNSRSMRELTGQSYRYTPRRLGRAVRSPGMHG